MARAFDMTPRHMPRGFVRYNVAPTQSVPVVRRADGQRVGDSLRWGLVPEWAHGQPTQYSTINARVETITTAATYRGPWRKGQRCIIPAVGYYEWQPAAGGKQPYLLRRAGGEAFGLCGLWEASTAADGTVLESFTVVTVPANPMVAEIHTKGRMPAMLTPEDCGAWLEGATDEARAVLAPFPAELMDAYPVSKRVNSPANDGPELIERIA